MACANVAGLLLVRATRRQSDIAVRQALGATRKHLALEALAETSLLALAGGVGGLVIAVAATPLIVALSSPDVPRLEFVAMNSRAFAFAAGVSVLVAFASALAPISLDAPPVAGRCPSACHTTRDRGRHTNGCDHW